jgi:hypothetical protein
METVFLSYSFKKTPPELLGLIESVLESHDIRPITGEHLEGRPLTPALEARIKEADGLIAILSPAAKLPGGKKFQPTMWVVTELERARGLSKPTITLNHPQVAKLPGEHEYIALDPKGPHPALLKLSHTVAGWKRRAGRRAKVRLLPAALEPSLDAALRADAAQGRYRLSAGEGGPVGPKDWRGSPLRVEPGGAFAYLRDVPWDALIELELTIQGKRWRSVATPQWLHVEMKEEA